MVQIHVYPQGGTTANHQMKVYFTTWSDGTWNESKATADVPYTAQNGWATVNIPIGNNPNWNAWIKQVRLDVDDTNNSTRFIVDSINIVPQTTSQ